jgi:hypothetical protein
MNTDIHSNIAQLQTTVYGVDGVGGVVRDHEHTKERLTVVEKRLDKMTYKWLLLMLLAGTLGNSLGSILMEIGKPLLP